MPGPGPHMMYAMTTGLGLNAVSNARFGPHHCLVYTVNAFFGPDIGSFSQWLTSTLGFAESSGSFVEDAVHHPFYYVLILGLPLSIIYSALSKLMLRKRVLESFGMALTRWQCLCLIAAGSLSHFFLDHLFEENGHSKMYMWILSTGWWEGRAPVNPDAVLVIGLLCSCLIGGFIYINRVKTNKSANEQCSQSLRLVLVIATLYCLWCTVQIYWLNPRRAAVGEEADLGVLVFLTTYFFLPHALCIMSMNSKEDADLERLPL